MRSGRQYVDALRDDRCVYLARQPVASVADHPGFAAAVQTIASLYDMALDPASDMIYAPPDGGPPANKVFMIPHTRADLEVRRLASTRWARATHGFIGRGPDHVAGFLAGFASAPDIFARSRPEC